jgi:hypothetical protein
MPEASLYRNTSPLSSLGYESHEIKNTNESRGRYFNKQNIIQR